MERQMTQERARLLELADRAERYAHNYFALAGGLADGEQLSTVSLDKGLAMMDRAARLRTLANQDDSK